MPLLALVVDACPACDAESVFLREVTTFGDPQGRWLCLECNTITVSS